MEVGYVTWMECRNDNGFACYETFCWLLYGLIVGSWGCRSSGVRREVMFRGCALGSGSNSVTLIISS